MPFSTRSVRIGVDVPPTRSGPCVEQVLNVGTSAALLPRTASSSAVGSAPDRFMFGSTSSRYGQFYRGPAGSGRMTLFMEGQRMTNRRTFLLGSAAAAAAGQTSDERIGTAVIGVGGRGSYLLKGVLAQPNARVLALCDIKPDRLDKAATAASRDNRPPRRTGGGSLT